MEMDQDCDFNGEAPFSCSIMSSAELLWITSILILLALYTCSNLHYPKMNAAWSVDYEGSTHLTPIPGDIVMITRSWCAVLLLGGFGLLLCGYKMSIPLIVISLCIVVSGLYITKPFFQTTFHIFTSLSWFAVFDLIIYAQPDERFLQVLMSPKGLYGGYLASIAVIRFQLGNKWQYKDLSHVTLGFILLLLYFWSLEVPACSVYRLDILCRYIGKGSNNYMQGSFTERIKEFIKLLFAHSFLNLSYAMNVKDFNSSSLEDKADGQKKKIEIVVEEDLTRRFSGATDTEDDVQVISDENGKRKFPDDCTEISEQEAIEIIQNGLNKFKDKKAT